MEFLLILGTIILLDFLSLLIPGQDFFIVSRNSLIGGKRYALISSLGIAIAQFLLCLLGMFGILKVLEWNPNILPFIKTLGAIYLIYLGGKIFKNAGNLTSINSSKSNKVITKKEAFRVSFFSTFINAEAMMFPLSLFAVIVPPHFTLMQKGIISGVIFIDTFLWYFLVGFLFCQPKFQKFFIAQSKKIERILGFILIFFGFKTLTSTK